MESILPTLLVVRHGETQWNAEGRIQGGRDTPLTLNGVRQAMAVGVALAERVEALGRPAFWVSPLGRAKQTASILAGVWCVPYADFVDEPLVAERNYGVWEGRRVQDIQRDAPDQHQADAADPWGYVVPEGENRAALDRRLRAWLQSLDRTRSHVVVTHSGCLRLLRGIYTGASAREIVAYREPQTSAFLLRPPDALALHVRPAILRAFGCDGAGHTVQV